MSASFMDIWSDRQSINTLGGHHPHRGAEPPREVKNVEKPDGEAKRQKFIDRLSAVGINNGGLVTDAIGVENLTDLELVDERLRDYDIIQFKRQLILDATANDLELERRKVEDDEEVPGTRTSPENQMTNELRDLTHLKKLSLLDRMNQSREASYQETDQVDMARKTDERDMKIFRQLNRWVIDSTRDMEETVGRKDQPPNISDIPWLNDKFQEKLEEELYYAATRVLEFPDTKLPELLKYHQLGVVQVSVDLGKAWREMMNRRLWEIRHEFLGVQKSVDPFMNKHLIDIEKELKKE